MIANPQEWVGKKILVQILEVNAQKGSVLVSRRKIVEQERAQKREITLQSIQIGQIIKGSVTSLTPYGAFVDIGGIEGLLHISDLSWNKSDKPQDCLKLGQEIDVKVLRFDATTQKVSLGRKQLLVHPWENLEKRIPIGSLVKGKVTGLVEFGAFVEIEPGIEGMVHVSELSWTEKVKHPKNLLKMGQEISVKFLSIDRENERISLSLKRTGPSPWEEVSKKFPVGSKFEAEIVHLASFGAFVKVIPGVEALLKTQDISWTERYSSPNQALKVGDKVNVMVLEINPSDEKMSVGIKQLFNDPLKNLKIGEKVQGLVKKILPSGLVVKLESGLEGFIKGSEIHLNRSIFSDPKDFSDNRNNQNNQVQHDFKEGDPITATVLKVSRKERKLDLSIRKYEQQEEKELLKKYSQKSSLTLGETTGWNDNSSDQNK
jgi:small subunit ribosomal protein S1